MPAGAPQTLHAIVERPTSALDAPAILAPDREPLSYRQLAAHIGDTTRALNALGIGRNDRVAVVLDNGPEMALAFLGIGAASTCAPLNPGYRAPEFDFYLEDLRAKALVVARGSTSPAIAVAQARGVRIVELVPTAGPAGRFTLVGEGGGPPASPGLAEPDDVALVLHTSGTTSRPKIVPLRHRNVCTSADNIVATLSLEPGDRCLNVMPLFHIHGLIGGLLSSMRAGASVVCSPGFLAPKFFDWIDAFSPTWYTAVPTMHQAVLARADRHRDVIARRKLRFIRSSSSALPPQVMEQIEAIFGAPIVEAYGMTEASHQMCCNPLPPRARKPRSVGVAAGPEVGTMDLAGKLLPRGATGELVIRGANVMSGYENNPKANAEAFTDGWFRTGDEGVIDEEGYVFLTGRIKEIINRGGEKISPREVDEVLMDHPAVQQVVTFAAPDDLLGEVPAAAVVLRPGAAATERELRELVAGRLADYKVPQRIVFLAEIPKGPTGKLARIGLAEKLGLTAEAMRGSAAQAAYVAPRDDLERTLAAIWQEVLRIERVGVDDAFLQLGGDSMLANELLIRVHDATDVEVPLIAFFDRPTVAGMAAEIAELRKRREAGLDLPGASLTAPIQPRADQASYPISFQQRNVFETWRRTWETNPSFLTVGRGYRVRGPIDRDALARALTEIVRRHEVLRGRLDAEAGGALRYAIAPPAPVEIVAVDLTAEPAAEARAVELARAELRRAFDVRRDVLLRATLFTLAPTDHVLVWTSSHVAIDAASVGVLVEELGALYAAFRGGAGSPLPALPFQYADYAATQAGRPPARIEEARRGWSEWMAMAGERAILLRSDRPRPARAADDYPVLPSRTVEWTLPTPLRAAMQAFGRKENFTDYVTMLAAWVALLHRGSGQARLPQVLTVNNRDRRGSDPVIGFFASYVVIQNAIAPTTTLRELLLQTREQALRMRGAAEVLPGEVGVHVTQLFAPRVRFDFRPVPPSLVLAGAEVKELSLFERSTRFEVETHVEVAPQAILGRTLYATELFDAPTIDRLLADYFAIIETMTRAPDTKLAALPTAGG